VKKFEVSFNQTGGRRAKHLVDHRGERTAPGRADKQEKKKKKTRKTSGKAVARIGGEKKKELLIPASNGRKRAQLRWSEKGAKKEARKGKDITRIRKK